MFSISYKNLPKTTTVIKQICESVDIQICILFLDNGVTKVVVSNQRDLDCITEIYELSQCGYTLDDLINLYYSELINKFYS